MVYLMKLWIDGGCRRNGYAGARAASAVVRKHQRRRYSRNKGMIMKRPLYQCSAHCNPITSQRAELAAAMQALECVIDKRADLGDDTRVKVIIHTDSRYVHDFVTDWWAQWEDNNWLNSRRKPVANQDLMKRLLSLEREVLSFRKVV